MNKVFAQVLKHLAREFVKRPEVRERARQLAEVGYTKASQLVAEWSAKRKLEAVPGVPEAAAAPRKKPARKKAKKSSSSRKSSAKKSGAKKSGARKVSSKRELITPHKGDSRYIRRDAKGRIKESDDVGRSLKQDRARKARTKVKSGQGDKGDR